MYFYFSSDRPAVIKIGGIYFGNITNTVKFLKADEAKPPLIEIIPLCASAGSCAFFPNEEFLACPPEAFAVTDLCGGYLINYFPPPAQNGAFNLIFQKKYRDLAVTVFSENGFKISLETPQDCFIETLRFEILGVTAYRKTCGAEEILFLAFERGENNETEKNKQIVCGYALSGKIKKIFEREVNDFSVENGIFTAEKRKDIAKHESEIFWEYNSEKREIYKARTKISRSPSFDKNKLPAQVLPYAFLEELAAGGDYIEYLTGNVLENANKLNGFFGEFIGVMPPPLFRKENETGIVYRAGERRYKTEYYIFELTSRKISNILKV